MDFRDSPAEAAFRAEARAFLDAHAPAEPMEGMFDRHDDEADFVRRSVAWQRTLFEHGWAAITWPREVGGRGLGVVERIIWSQELARRGLSTGIFLVGIGMAGPAILVHGTDAQKQRYLPPMLRGDEIWCQLFSEPGAGSDLAGLACRAERAGDAWVVTGQKTWSSGAHYAHWGILLARTDPNLPKHKGITYFLVDMRTPGIEVRPMKQMNGASHFGEVFFENVRIPHEAILGGEGAGWGVAMTTLMNERASAGASGSGSFAIEELIERVRALPGGADGVTRDALARLYTRMRTIGFLNARMLTKIQRGENAMAEAAVIKLLGARLATEGANFGLRLLGPEALVDGGDWQQRFLFAPAVHIAGGTDEVQKNIAAEMILGLPKEPSPEKLKPFKDIPRNTVT